MGEMAGRKPERGRSFQVAEGRAAIREDGAASSQKRATSTKEQPWCQRPGEYTWRAKSQVSHAAGARQSSNVGASCGQLWNLSQKKRRKGGEGSLELQCCAREREESRKRRESREGKRGRRERDRGEEKEEERRSRRKRGKEMEQHA